MQLTILINSPKKKKKLRPCLVPVKIKFILFSFPTLCSTHQWKNLFGFVFILIFIFNTHKNVRLKTYENNFLTFSLLDERV